MMNCEDVARNNVIERYLAGRLAVAERDAFEQHYFDCEACFEQLETVRVIRAGVASSGEPAGALKYRRWWWGAGGLAAAALALLLYSPWQSRHPGPSPAPVAHDAVLLRVADLEAPPYTPALYRGGGRRAAFARAMEFYQKREFAAAAEALRPLAAAAPPDAAWVHFLGASLLMLGEAAEPVALFDRVIAMGAGSPFEEEARFCRAQALLVAGRVTEARAELQRVVAMQGDYEKKARLLLAKQ